jgi:hypothetical protein
MCVSMCVYPSVRVLMFVFVHVCVCVSVYDCERVCSNTHTYTHTQRHTGRQKGTLTHKKRNSEIHTQHANTHTQEQAHTHSHTHLIQESQTPFHILLLRSPPACVLSNGFDVTSNGFGVTNNRFSVFLKFQTFFSCSCARHLCAFEVRVLMLPVAVL